MIKQSTAVQSTAYHSWTMYMYHYDTCTAVTSCTLNCCTLLDYHPHSEGGIIFSSVCVFVSLSVCQRDNSRTIRDDISTTFSGHHHIVKRVFIVWHIFWRVYLWNNVENRPVFVDIMLEYCRLFFPELFFTIKALQSEQKSARLLQRRQLRQQKWWRLCCN